MALIKSTKDFMKVFPELENHNKFKTSIDRLFKELNPNLAIEQARDFKVFIGAKTGKGYKSKLVHLDTNKSSLFQRSRLCTSDISKIDVETNPSKFKDIQSSGTRTLVNGQWADSNVIATYENTDRTSWPELARLIGKLMESRLTGFDCCDRCSGTGRIPQFAHIDDGLCFKCMGVGRWFKIF